MDKQEREQEITKLEDYLAEHADEIKVADASARAFMRWATPANLRGFEGQWVAFYNGRLVGSCVTRSGLRAMLRSEGMSPAVALIFRIDERGNHAPKPLETSQVFRGITVDGVRYVVGELLILGFAPKSILFRLDEDRSQTLIGPEDLAEMEIPLDPFAEMGEPVITDLGIATPRIALAWLRLGIDSPRLWTYALRVALLPPSSASPEFRSRLGRDLLDRVVLQVEPDGEFMIIADEDRCLHVRPNTDREE